MFVPTKLISQRYFFVWIRVRNGSISPYIYIWISFRLLCNTLLLHHNFWHLWWKLNHYQESKKPQQGSKLISTNKRGCGGMLCENHDKFKIQHIPKLEDMCFGSIFATQGTLYVWNCWLVLRTLLLWFQYKRVKKWFWDDLMKPFKYETLLN